MSDLIATRSDGATLMMTDQREYSAWKSLNPIPRDRAWIMLYLLREWGYQPRLNEGKRSKERQAQLVAEGKSKTLNSDHLTGDAWDICDLAGGWDCTKEFKRAVGRACRIAGVVWGGQWLSFGPLGDWAHCSWRRGAIVG